MRKMLLMDPTAMINYCFPLFLLFMSYFINVLVFNLYIYFKISQYLVNVK